MSEPDYKAMLLSVMAEFEAVRFSGEEDGWWVPEEVVGWWEASPERVNVVAIIEAESSYDETTDLRQKLAEAEVAFLDPKNRYMATWIERTREVVAAMGAADASDLRERAPA